MAELDQLNPCLWIPPKHGRTHRPRKRSANSSADEATEPPKPARERCGRDGARGDDRYEDGC